jgi:CelD/BcsL family acetyltransferase involved in cellulose biosynthesis
LLKDVRRARRKCESFEARVDLPEGAEWVIRNWGRKWRVAQHRVEDMVVAARMRGALGLYHNTVFYDGDRPIGGHTEVVDGSDVVGQAVYRDSDYDRYSLGTWMFDRLAFWAVDAGYEGLDFGGTGEYKSRWARVGGRKFVIQVTPVHERMIASLQAALRTPRRRGTSSVGRAPRTMTSDARSH